MKQIAIGLSLEGLSILTGYLSMWLLYAAGWFGILLFSLPLYIAAVVVLMRAPAPLWVRLLLSLWPLILPLTKWEVW